MSDRIYTIDEIRDRISPVAAKHGVDKIYLFGSYARGNATPSSDIDLCVDAPRIRGLFALGGLYADLEASLEKGLDLITTNSLNYSNDKVFLDNLQKERVLIYAQ